MAKTNEKKSKKKNDKNEENNSNLERGIGSLLQFRIARLLVELWRR